MARDRTSLVASAATLSVPKPNALVASAARSGKGGAVTWSKIQRSQSDVWQKEAWNFYKTIGEFRYACDWVGSMISKAILFATNEVEGRPEKVTTGPAAEFMDSLFGDTDGKAEMLRLIGIHMSVTGECFLVGYEKTEENDEGVKITEEDHWEVVAATELRNAGSKTRPIWHVNGQRLAVEDHKDVFIIRMWRPDPEKTEFAISPARAILSTLGELQKLSEYVSAQVDSRLAGAGILLMPTEMTFPTPPPVEGEEPNTRTANTADDLMKVISEAMEVALEDRSDPASRVPTIITAPGDVIDKIKHVTFWSELDEHAMELRNEAIRRLALGMDMPPEVLQGVSESTQWNAWQADESAIKAHTEPLLKIITTALAQGFLRPLLADALPAGTKITGYSIKADTSEMRLRPNRSKEALELYNLGLLSGEALLRESGFDTIGDKMDTDEQKEWFLRKIATGSTTPEQVEAAMKVLFQIDLRSNTPADTEPTEGRPQPTTRNHPTRDLPDQEIGERRKIARAEGREGGPSTASLFGAEQIVMRALERAGNRMRNRVGGKMSGISAARTYLTYSAKADDLNEFLDDAFGENVTSLARHMEMDADKLTSILDAFCRSLLVSQKEYSFAALERHFALAFSEDMIAS